SVSLGTRRPRPEDRLIGRFVFRWFHRRVTNRPMGSKLSIGFLGAGKMATALAKGFIRAGLVTPKQVIASDPSGAAAAAFAKEVGAKTTASNAEVAKFAEVLVLAVKPDQASGVLSEI